MGNRCAMYINQVTRGIAVIPSASNIHFNRSQRNRPCITQSPQGRNTHPPMYHFVSTAQAAKRPTAVDHFQEGARTHSSQAHQLQATRAMKTASLWSVLIAPAVSS